MTSWNVPITVKLGGELPDPQPSDVEVLVASLPGGGFGTSFAGADYFATRVFTKTVTVEADDAHQAEKIAKKKMEDAIEAVAYQGWSVASTGEASLAS